MSTERRTAGFDFLESSELPAPQVSAERAAGILEKHYGIRATVTPLGSNQDQNFTVTDSAGETVGVLKIANPAFTTVELQAQDAAAALIAHTEPGLRVAVPQPNLTGDLFSAIDGLLDGTAYVRLLTYLPGGTLIDADYLSPTAVAGLGRIAGRVSRALATFHHAGLDRILQWDLRYGADVVDRLLPHIEDDDGRARLRAAARQAWDRIERVADALPCQAIHLDITDANVVAAVGSGAREPDGVIDFGDLSTSWAVSELAITASSILGHSGAEPTSILPAVRAFHEVRPLSAAEVAALWPMLVLRTAVLVVSSAQQAAIDPDNSYVSDQADGEWRMFRQAVSVPMDVMTAVIADELGVAADPPPLDIPATPVISAIDLDAVVTLDLSTRSDALDSAFATRGWPTPALEDQLARAAVQDGAQLVLTRYGEPRLTRVVPLRQGSADVVATGVSGWPASPTSLIAPWDGVLTTVGDRVTLRSDSRELTLGTVRPTREAGPVRAGETVAEAAADAWFGISVRPVPDGTAFDGTVPAFTRPELAPGWLALTCDPRPLLGLAADDHDIGSNRIDLIARRDRSFAPVQEHYYREPPQIERGWRHHLFSTAGRSYLDMVNNVTMLGHAHPRVAATAARQLRRLNTNSRFNYEAVVEFSERLAAMLPEPLDTVFLVNSGSEASDLALRLATAATGRPDVVAVREAYHGWTYGTDAVSTSTADNPNALATRPDWVHTVESPNSFRGKYRGTEADRYAVEAVAQIRAMIEAGRPPAAFICEAVYGNAGGMALPDHYLEQVYLAVRSGGGLAVADEVQVGYGRLGEWFWGFQQQNVVPDIVSMAKSTGNGYPLGAVITTRAVADAFSSQGYFFSSTGGSPLSCAIGITVLDVLKEEGLQQNAARVGAHLKARLLALRDKHPIIGTVHGVGLYLGVEFVRDAVTLEPAPEETAAICDRMLELGVVIQPTGDHQNILKTKPPLCIDVKGADFYVDTLDRVLSEGW